MGFEDRDYSQEESWMAAGQPETPVTKWFVIITVAVFMIQLFTGAPARSSVIYSLLELRAESVLHGEVWRLVTFAVCNHPVDILGLVFSLLIIWKFGGELERMYGTREVLHCFLGIILFVSIPFVLCGLVADLPIGLGGSFPVALGLLALFATHYPRMEVYILPLISIQLRWLVALYALFGLYPSFMVLQNGGGLLAIAYGASVLGIAFALIYRKYDWHLAALTSRVNVRAFQRSWRNRVARRRLKVFAPPSDARDLETRVDALLAKIHEHGSESLTDEERQILVKASERMKNRS